MIQVEVDFSRMTRQLKALQISLYKAGKSSDANKLLRQECQLYGKQLLSFTPPDKQAQGNAAVLRDISNCGVPMLQGWNAKLTSKLSYKETTVGFVAFDKSIQSSIRKKDYASVQEWLKTKPSLASYTVRPWDGGRMHWNLHKSYSRGRVRTKRHIFTLDVHEWKRYVAKIQTHVGYLKSGWIPALSLLNVKWPQWITRHGFRKPGRAISQLDDYVSPSFTFVNTSSFAGQLRHHARQALNARMNALSRRLAFIIKRYNIDVLGGKMITNKAGQFEYWMD